MVGKWGKMPCSKGWYPIVTMYSTATITLTTTTTVATTKTSAKMSRHLPTYDVSVDLQLNHFIRINLLPSKTMSYPSLHFDIKSDSLSFGIQNAYKWIDRSLALDCQLHFNVFRDECFNVEWGQILSMYRYCMIPN